VLGQLGPFTTQKLALKQAQALADLGYIEDGILVTVEKVGGKRKNPSSRSYKGHKIKGKTGKYTVEPYGYEFPNLKAAKGWLDKHVRDAYPAPKKATKRRKNWGAGSFAEKPVTLLFSTKEKANAFKKSLDKNEVSGKFSTRKTKGWNTYSLVFTPHSYSDVVAIHKYYRPEKSHYKDIERDLRTNPSKRATPWITREGKLGGPGYTKRTAKARHALLNKCVKGYGYRSCLGSLQVLLLNSEMGNTARKVILTDKNWLEKKYGGPGSFGPRKK
tara:strand:+ start:3837 stop:4655 length:819 start_codon:yes stop_codon:yes gene_type:complete